LEIVSLYQLNQYIKQVYAVNFEEEIWIKAEISQCRASKGHWYLELVEKDLNTQMVIAQSSAVIWAGDYRNLQRSIGDELDNLLKAGAEVKMLVEVSFHERYGQKLIIRNIDLEFTLGNLELQKRAILAKLESENLLSLNKNRPLPYLLQRIAVISSSGAAGYMDFMAHLVNNEYGYDFKIKLFEASMQGLQVKVDICKHLSAIDSANFDCIVIIRGGGSRLDLSDFDDYEIAKAIALCDLPIITGIGHEIDVSIADLVAHTSLKTPTAVASFLISKLLDLEGSITGLGNDLYDNLQNFIFRESMRLSDYQSKTIRLQSVFHQAATNLLDNHRKEINYAAINTISRANMSLQHLKEQLNLLDYRNVLKRGFSFLMKEDKLVQSIKDLKTGDDIVQVLHDGKINSKVTNIIYGKEN